MTAPLLFLLVAVASRTTPDTTNRPRFDRVLLLDTFADTSANVSIADLNGDGNLDILLVKGRHWPNRSRVLLGDGRGHILSAHNLSETAYRSYSGRLTDLDGDGHLDVVLSNDQPDLKLTFLNDGTGHFRAGSAYGHPEWATRNAALADVNGDGLPDIVVANRADSAVAYICLNRGKGRFDGNCDALTHASATTITPADFNRDGRTDLVVPHRDRGQSYVYLNGGNGRYPVERRVPFGPADARIRVAEVADLDGDGLLDIVVIDEAKGVAIYFGQGPTFRAALALDNGKVTPYALAIGDLNQDGKPDIIVGNVEAPSVVHFNDGTGRHYIPARFGDSQGTAYGFAIADLDRDGLMDIAVAKSDAPSAVYFADHQRPAAARVKIPVSGSRALAADLYGSGDHAIVVLAHGGYSSLHSWAPQAEAVSEAGFRVLVVEAGAAADLAAGRETACLYDEKCLAQDVLAGIRYLRQLGARRFSLLAGSMGGAAAAQASVEAGATDIDGMVLLAPGGIQTPEKMKGRKLFITTRDDANAAGPRLPGIQAQYDRTPEPKQFTVLNGSAHAQRIFGTPEGARVLADIIAFLKKPGEVP